MPITQSAKKALRQNLSRHKTNLKISKAFKEAIKKLKKSPNSINLSLAYEKLDKAVKSGVIAKNKASRTKSRLSKLLKK